MDRPCPLVRLALLPAAVLLAVPAVAAERSDEWRYAVQRGDTLIGIGEQFLAKPGAWRRVQRLNRIADPRRLRPGAQLRIPLALLRSEPVVAELLQTSGAVSVSGDGVVAGRLSRGQTIETGEDGSALLRFGDGTQLRVSPASRLTLEQALVLRGNQQQIQTLQLQQGHVQSQVRREAPRPRFEIRAPVLTLGARGTEFRIGYDPAVQTAQGAVDEGEVAARGSSQAEVRVGAGFGIVGSSTGLSSPTALLEPPPWAQSEIRAERLPVRIDWPQQPGAVRWQAQLFAAGPSEGPLLAERRSDRPYAEWGPLPDGSYRLRLRSVDAQGLAGRASTALLTVAARPEPPFLAEPPQDAVRTGARSTLRWLKSAAAARYRVQLASAAEFAPPLRDLADIAAAEVSVELTPGRWFWRVASVQADGRQGPWSDVQAFEQKPEPPPPAAPAAPQSASTGDGKLSFRWSAGREGDRYEFQLARDGAFTQRLLERTSDTPVLELAQLDPGPYHLRARIVDARGVASDWGPAAQFEVPRSTAWWWIPAAVLLLLLL